MQLSRKQDMPEHCKSDFVLSSPSADSSRVVAPLAVMEQWAAEIRTKTVKGHIKVTTHHGPSRVKGKSYITLPSLTIRCQVTSEV